MCVCVCECVCVCVCVCVCFWRTLLSISLYEGSTIVKYGTVFTGDSFIVVKTCVESHFLENLHKEEQCIKVP